MHPIIRLLYLKFLKLTNITLFTSLKTVFLVSIKLFVLIVNSRPNYMFLDTNNNFNKYKKLN